MALLSHILATAIFYGASLAQIARHLAASRAARVQAGTTARMRGNATL